MLGDGRSLKIGVTIPFSDHQSSYPTILTLAHKSAEAGFDSIWMADHLTGPTPYGATAWHDVITLLTAITCRVPSLAVGTDVLVAALRHPVLAAKMLTTLDIVSEGRLTVATGVGYIESEFQELGAPFADRGAYSEECVGVWRSIWSDGNAHFAGRYFALDDVTANPKPLQRPGPPVWFGGSADPVIRRTARIGDGWHPISLTIDDYRQRLDMLRTACQDVQRERPVTLSYSGGFGVVTKERGGADRLPLSGSPVQVLDDIHRLEELGVSNIVFRFGLPEASNDEVLDQVARVGDEVLPRLDGSASRGDTQAPQSGHSTAF
jgi:probable F420-dependent oxidoreductase